MDDDTAKARTGAAQPWRSAAARASALAGTIRGRILIACLAMSVITAGLGGYAALNIGQSSALVGQTFDRSLMSINYARAAAADFAAMQAALARRWMASDPDAKAKLDDAMDALGRTLEDDLAVAAARSHSTRAARAAARVKRSVAAWSEARGRLLAGSGPDAAWADVDRHAALVEQEIEMLINYTAGDGFKHRQSARATIAQATRLNLAATTLALLLSALVAWLLARRLIGPVAAASAAAERIAAGQLDSAIPQGGADELGALLAAMGVMRDNIRAMVDGEVAQRRSAQARLADALENMSQGLCLYDADDRLQVVNRRFCEIFGLPPEQVRPGIALRDVLALSAAAGNHGDKAVPDLLAEHADMAAGHAPSVQELGDGRAIAIVRQPTADGGWVATYEDVTERRRAEAQVSFMARHDALTRLPNRILLGERVEQAFAQAGRGGGFAVLCLDLDGFKQVNDTLGHPIGDDLLRKVAERLRACVRDVDTVARLGGDEFAVVQQGAGRAEDAAALANRIVEVVSVPYDLDGHQVTISVSLGIALAPGDGLSSDKLLKNADVALYRAKEDGRGTWRFFEAEMDARLQARRTLELDLREAVARGEFELFYQPIFDLRRDRISGFEALLRWRHPARGMVSPAEFVPLAEEIGLIAPIGEWALRRACADASRWPGCLKVAVNVSPAQFKGDRLAQTVADALSAAGLPAQRLELEITESVLLTNNAATLAALHALRRLGLSISLDDFGTGYSSLSYLRSFPFGKIKIDRSFVSDLGSENGAGAIIRATISLARSFGMMVTAEGVESEEQLTRLRRKGCDEAQGYFISPPVPGREIPRLIERWTPAEQKVA